MLTDPAKILAIEDMAERVEIQIPEWGDSVTIRPLTAAERDSFEASIQGGGAKLVNVRARLAALSIINPETGARVFTTAEQITALGAKHSKALDRIFDEAQTLNGMTNKDVDDLEKN